jgi:hypothetical protein
MPAGSSTVPESVVVAPASAQVGICAQTPVQPHWFAFAPPHVWGSAQVPHESMLPQPSPICPQFAFCCAHVIGVHASGVVVPHWLGPALPHDSPMGQVPHWMTPPHFGSVTGPQLALS